MADSKRNIVLIISDSVRADFLSCYGADFMNTPNIDALAENGIVFENACTPSTVCGPARGSILTGVNVSCHDSWTNEMPFSDSVEFFPDRLRKDGYACAAIGTLDHAMEKVGYHYINTVCLNDDDEYIKNLRKKYPDASANALFSEEDPHYFRYDECDHYDRYACDRATDFIEEYSKTHKIPNDSHTTNNAPAEEGAPFFMVCGFLMPHSPHIPPKEMRGRVNEEKMPPIRISHRDADVPTVEKNRRAWFNPSEALEDPEGALPERTRERRAYCEMICEIDDLVGRITDKLKETGLYENTTIIFCADHGSMEHDYNMLTKGPYPYSPQLFVPLIVSNCGSAHGRCDEVVSTLDIGATALDIAGDDKRFGLSRSLIGQANGTVSARENFMVEFCDSVKTIVDKRYTFSYYPFSGETGLYDRQNDPYMTKNISGTDEKLEAKYLKDIIDWLLLNKTVRIEAHDLVPKVQEGMKNKDPKYPEGFDVCFPLASKTEVERLNRANLPSDFNEFCRTYPIKAHYGVYFFEDEK